MIARVRARRDGGEYRGIRVIRVIGPGEGTVKAEVEGVSFMLRFRS